MYQKPKENAYLWEPSSKTRKETRIYSPDSDGPSHRCGGSRIQHVETRKARHRKKKIKQSLTVYRLISTVNKGSTLAWRARRYPPGTQEAKAGATAQVCEFKVSLG